MIGYDKIFAEIRKKIYNSLAEKKIYQNSATNTPFFYDAWMHRFHSIRILVYHEIHKSSKSYFAGGYYKD